MDRCERENRILALDVTDSTNTVLKRMALEGAAAGQVVTAAEQTAGKGRLGRSFHSPKGQGIYLSYLMRPDSISNIAEITCWAAVAARRAVEEAAGVCADIKWVNDLVLSGKKICGILTESVFAPDGSAAVIIGIGINVNGKTEDLPEDIRAKAGFISQFCGGHVTKEIIEAALIAELDKITAKFPNGKSEYLAEYRKFCPIAGRDVAVMKDGGKKGKAIEINDDFSLKIQYSDGTVENVSTGEVSVRGLYGYVPE